MFIFKATVILEEIERYLPRHYQVLEEINTHTKAGLDKEALAHETAKYFDKNSTLKSLDCNNNIIISDDYIVGVMGFSDLIIVQTDGKLLVCHKSRA